MFNLRNYFLDKQKNEIKKLDKELYNFNWQKLIDSLLEIDYKKRIDINQVNILLEEFNENNFVKPINEINYLNDGEKFENIIKGEIYINKYDKNGFQLLIHLRM